MPSPSAPTGWIDTGKLREDLGNFFDEKRQDLSIFGSTVNQTFEAFVFASVISWYRERGWSVGFKHPMRPGVTTNKTLRLKFSTRGRPDNYTYVTCINNNETLQIRHQLRVATHSHKPNRKYRANIVLDVAVIKEVDLSLHGTSDYVDNRDLVTFGEAKHMSAFAELVASFIGIVYEMQPGRLKRRRFKSKRAVARPLTPGHLPPFLFVSGVLYPTANGVVYTIANRGFDMDIYWRTKQLSKAIAV